MRREENEKNSNEESNSILRKISNNIYFLFCGSDQLDPSVNTLIIFNTYMQIAEIAHILILYTWFHQSNNFLYNAVQSVFSGLIFFIALIPRANNRHYGLLLTFIVFLILTVSAAAGSAILILNYFTFTNYCNLLANYSNKNSSFTFMAQDVCSSVSKIYYLNFGADVVVTLLRIIYLYLNLKAYRVVKHKFDEQEKKKRRSEKFDEKQKNKTPYDPNRKI